MSRTSSENEATNPIADTAVGGPKVAETRSQDTGIQPRSCIVCRSRKVRCDRQSPCSNCRKGNVACVFPTSNRPPRWSRRFTGAVAKTSPENTTTNPRSPGARGVEDDVAERLKDLEGLVKDLRCQLEQAQQNRHVVSPIETGEGNNADEAPFAADMSDRTTHSNQARFFENDQNQKIYSNIWSLVSEELHGLKLDLQDDFSDDEGEVFSDKKDVLDDAPRDVPFFFGNVIEPPTIDIRNSLPSASQMPMMMEIFSSNVNIATQAVHMPTIKHKLLSSSGYDVFWLDSSNTALLFSICYASVISMDEDTVSRTFGASQADLGRRYRLGLEYSLAKSDFLTSPSLVLGQALTVFLSLARRFEHPRFIWMMTGILVRMAQSIGLQRDGDHYPHMSPFEREMRRRVWWLVFSIDMRASEDQRTPTMIDAASFDTKVPLNLNDSDIGAETREMPAERDELADMSYALMSIGINRVAIQITNHIMSDREISIEDRSRLLQEVYENFENDHRRILIGATGAFHWFAVTAVRLVMAKTTLGVFLPVIFSTPSEDFTYEIRTNLFLSAIEVAENNHALNSEPAYTPWHWICQTYTHWHAIVYLLLEMSRRPWSPVVEKAWMLLKSKWLIPSHAREQSDHSIWAPLRKLAVKALRHRQSELSRLQEDREAMEDLAQSDEGNWSLSIPFGSEPLPTQIGFSTMRQWWLQQIMSSNVAGQEISRSQEPRLGTISLGSTHDYSGVTGRQLASAAAENRSTAEPDVSARSLHHNTPTSNEARSQSHHSDQQVDSDNSWNYGIGSSYGLSATAQARNIGPGSVAWLWADSNGSNDIFSNIDLDASTGIYDSVDVSTDWIRWIDFVGEHGSEEGPGS